MFRDHEWHWNGEPLTARERVRMAFWRGLFVGMGSMALAAITGYALGWSYAVWTLR